MVLGLTSYVIPFMSGPGIEDLDGSGKRRGTGVKPLYTLQVTGWGPTSDPILLPYK